MIWQVHDYSFWIKLANVKESFTQSEEYNFRNGTKISANHLASSCWEEPNHRQNLLKWDVFLMCFGQAIHSRSL